MIHAARNRVVAGQPILLPIVLAPGLLVGREVGFVAVKVNLVGKDAHAQLDAAVGEREEASLQANWEQHEWHIARTQGLR